MLTNTAARLLARPVVAIVALALCALAPPAHATPPPASAVRALLAGVDDAAPPDAFRRLGPETVLVLARLYNDPAELLHVRQRAVTAAGYFPGAAAGAFLRAVLRAAPQDELVVHAALLALPRAVGAACEPDLAPYLAADAVIVRDAAARALALIATPGARHLARARLALESHPVVRATLARALHTEEQ